MKSISLKPQDILLALKIVARGAGDFRLFDIAYELGVSLSEVSHGLNRLAICGIFEQDKRTPKKNALLEFLVHGLKYVYPATPGREVRGIPTANIKKDIRSAEALVWPYELGENRGHALVPIFHSAPKAALKDEKLYRMLASIDQLRVGREREQAIAKKELIKLFGLESEENAPKNPAR